MGDILEEVISRLENIRLFTPSEAEIARVEQVALVTTLDKKLREYILELKEAIMSEDTSDYEKCIEQLKKQVAWNGWEMSYLVDIIAQYCIDREEKAYQLGRVDACDEIEKEFKESHHYQSDRYKTNTYSISVKRFVGLMNRIKGEQ